MREPRSNPREEYRERESQRLSDSASLADRFSDLKSLTVDLAYFGSETLNKLGALKYTVTLTHAKSLFRFDCPNEECVGGDFDLSRLLAEAVAAHEPAVAGELVCQGWRNKATIDRVPCHHVLRFRLSLGY